MRQLIHDGAPAENITGVDLQPDFFPLGYELFQDKDTLKSKLLAGNILDDSFLRHHQGQYDIVYLGAFLHLFPQAEQERLASRIVQLLKPKVGSIILGRQCGANPCREYDYSADGGKGTMFYHSPSTMDDMWQRQQPQHSTWLTRSHLIPWPGKIIPVMKEHGCPDHFIVFYAERKSLDE